MMFELILAAKIFNEKFGRERTRFTPIGPDGQANATGLARIAGQVLYAQ